MRVCLVSYEFPPEIGGEASYAHELAAGLSSLGHAVTVLVPKKRGVEYAHDGRFRVLRVKTSSLPMLKVASFVLAVNRLLPRLVKGSGIELVHYTFDYPSLPVRAGGLGAPVIATIPVLPSRPSLPSSGPSSHSPGIRPVNQPRRRSTADPCSSLLSVLM